MSQYVDLVCGDVSVLVSDGEDVGARELLEARKKLLLEFATLADGAGTKAMIAEQGKRHRAMAELTLFKVLNNLLAIGAHDDVRLVLREYGIGRQLSDKQVEDEVGRLLRRARTNVAKTSAQAEETSKEPTPDEIRENFDRQAASLMTYFKFQIDLNVISAAQFACMADQAQREVNARLAASTHK